MSHIDQEYSEILTSHRPVVRSALPLRSSAGQVRFNSVNSICSNELYDPEEDKIRSRFKEDMEELRSFVARRRRVCDEELSDRAKAVQESEKDITHVSPRHHEKWRYLQKRVPVLSLLKDNITKVRRFGIKPARNNQVLRLKEETRPRNPTAIYPDNSFLKLHVAVLLCVLAFLVLFSPLDLAFSYSENYRFWESVDLAITCYFALDILVSFFSAYYESNGALVDSNLSIARAYLLRWFLLDLLSVLPFDLFLSMRNLMFKRLLKVPRILRLFNSMFQNTESKKQTRNLIALKFKKVFSTSRAYAISKPLLYTLLFIHFSACFWCFLHSMQDQSFFSK